MPTFSIACRTKSLSFHLQRFSKLMASSSSSPTNTVSPATEDVESGTLEVKVSDEVDKRKLEGPQKGPKQKKAKTTKNVGRPGFGDDMFDETEYYFENGLRKVRPYAFTFTTYCKGRWDKKKLVDVFAKEFRAQPIEEFEKSILRGTITVNNKPVPLDYVLRQSDFIANKAHRHEVPVIDQPIHIVHQSDDFVVVDKPPSIPVHPCGRYRHNSLIFILAKEYGFRGIRNAYRIDRLTSGLVIFTRSVEKDRELKSQISSRNVQKEYLCRVEGEFPSEPVICTQPIAVVSYKIGVCRVKPNGKECKTEFKKISYNGKSSVVLCKPSTGRMHQIRVHLQYLGYPIVNDPLYNHSVFGPEKGKNGDIGKTDDQLIEELIKVHNTEAWLGEPTDTDLGGSKEPSHFRDNFSSVENNSPDIAEDKSIQSKSSPYYDPFCPECNGQMTFRDPKPEDLIMYLHAWKYKGDGWEFETDIPFWAKEDWTKV